MDAITDAPAAGQPKAAPEPAQAPAVLEPVAPPQAAPVPAPVNLTGTLTVGSRLSSGMRIILPSGNYLVGGVSATHTRAGYAATPDIPAAEFEQWLVDHADADFVRAGLIVVLSRQPE